MLKAASSLACLLISVSAPGLADRPDEELVHPAIGTHCQPDYFVVSTNNCPQKPGQCCCCQFGIERCYGCGSARQVSLESMLRSFQPGVPVVIAVHGSAVEEKELKSITEQRYRRLAAAAGNRPAHHIAFHWPSELTVPFFPAMQANQLGKRAGLNGIYLAQLIRMIPADHPIGLVGHSHGTRVISSALHLLGGGCIDGCRVPENCPSRRIRAVYAASAIDSHWLNPGEKYGKALDRVECLLLLRTRKDYALSLYQYRDPCLHCALGKTGFRKRDLRRMNCNNRRKTREFDVTPYVGHAHSVLAYMPHGAIWRSAVPYLWFD